MTIFGVLITYACCWWLVLFMVLPWKVKMAENPQPGPAASAPINPFLKQKLFITTLLAIIPTVVLYVLIGTARAEEPDMYRTNSKCAPVEHKADADVAVRDGYATGGKKVPPANMAQENSMLGTADNVYVGIDVPTEDYTDPDADLRFSEVYVGAVKVGMDGSTSFNGQPLSQQPLNNEDCK